MHSYTTLLQLLVEARKNGFTQYFVDELEDAIKDNIREEKANLKGLKSELSIINDIIKYNKKYNPGFNGYMRYEDRYAFVTPYRIVISDDNFGYEEAENQIDIGKYTKDCNAELDLEIDIADLRTHIEVNKAAKQNKAYTIEKGGVRFSMNPKYIIESIKLANNNILKVCPRTRLSDNQNINPYYQFNKETGKLVTVTLPILLKE